MITQKRLKEILHYDPETGHWKWISSSGSRAVVGERPGWINGAGYICFSVDKRKYRSHQLAWLYMTGEYAGGQIDHVNRVRDDNRWGNLRKADQSQQNQNAKIRSNNTSGYRGVSMDNERGKWGSVIWKDKTHYFCGYYDDPIDAARAYDAKALELYGAEFAFQNLKEKHVD